LGYIIYSPSNTGLPASKSPMTLYVLRKRSDEHSTGTPLEIKKSSCSIESHLWVSGNSSPQWPNCILKVCSIWKRKDPFSPVIIVTIKDGFLIKSHLTKCDWVREIQQMEMVERLQKS